MGRPIGSRYELAERLGRGAYGSVYRGTVRQTGEPIAIKVLLEELANDPEVVTRFLRERKALTSLRHPSIVSVRDLVVEGDLLALVMQLVDGPDLKAYLGERGRLDPLEAALLTGDIAEALAAAHHAGIVHRDVKPANVLLEHVGNGLRPMLTDFGVARIADVPSVTRTHQVVGTPYYLAPEVLAGQASSPAMDVYAMGVMLYELCAGRPPFDGPDAMSVFKAHMDATPPRPDGMPDEVWAVVAECMAKDPARRPVAGALRERLRTAAGAPMGGADPLAAATTVNVKLDPGLGTVLLPMVRDAPYLRPVATPQPASSAPMSSAADAVTRMVPPVMPKGPIAGWDAPPSADAFGYQRRRPQTEGYGQPQQDYGHPAGPYGQPTDRNGATRQYTQFAPQAGQQQGQYPPQPQYPPAGYAPPREQRYPPPGPLPPLPSRRRAAEEDEEPDYEPPRRRPRPRGRGVGPGFGCLFRLLMFLAVVLLALYVLERIDADVHQWWQHVQNWGNQQWHSITNGLHFTW